MVKLDETLSQSVLDSFNNQEIIIPLILSAIVTIIATWLIFHEGFIFEFIKVDRDMPHPLKRLINFAISVGVASLIAIVITWGIFKLFSLVELLLINGIEVAVEVTGGLVNLIVENLLLVIILFFAYLILKQKNKIE